jgi:hypothetical protein
MMHVIQKEILAKLIAADSLRFSQLKPKHLESNHFMYHLRALMREAEWLYSGDTSEDSFLRRVAEIEADK